MPDYFVYRRKDQWYAQRDRHNGKEPKGDIFRIIAKTKRKAISAAREIVRGIEEMNVEAQGSTVSQSTEVKSEENKCAI